MQVMETYTIHEDEAPEDHRPGPDLITHVAIAKLNTHDGAALVPALDDTETRGIKPAVVLADTHYGSNENLRRAAGRGVEVVAPAMTAKGSKRGQLTLERFELDENGHVLRCPGGHAPLSTSGGADKIQALFDAATCSACPLLSACPASAVGRREARYQYTPDRVRQRERRLRDRTDGFRERYRWRSGIEGTMSRLKYQMGLASLRVRGLASVSYRTFLRALGLNIRRIAACRAVA